MKQGFLNSLSPLDGRYKKITEPLSQYFSESALISHRIQIEILYLKALSKNKIIRSFTQKELIFLDNLSKFNQKNCEKVKKIEKITHHDVKAIEYFLREVFQKISLKDISSYIHFAITSEDINNLSYRLMVKNSCQNIIFPVLLQVLSNLNSLSQKYQNLPMLARTHGQPAIPTTLGKEICVFSLRLQKKLQKLFNHKLNGKFNGAIGSYNAMFFAYPKIDWKQFSKNFIKNLNLEFNCLTTQINPHDDLIELFSLIQQTNTILINLNQDIWRYISDDWLIQKGKDKYIGSSTMPQKINPIEFENSEGNLGLSNCLLEFFIQKLPISRLQRDLSDSTVLRNIGSSFGYCLLAYQSLNHGLENLEANRQKIKKCLNENWNILSEALQTEERLTGNHKAYEKASQLAKNQILNRNDWQEISKNLSHKLQKLEPETYLGLSKKITRNTIIQINKFIKNYKFN